MIPARPDQTSRPVPRTGVPTPLRLFEILDENYRDLPFLVEIIKLRR